ncbi:hypothetical protein DFH27DRAFT_575376 [Peziza echinospora]|nr:hypothetical protein DFH27DRAFT_575376 [Peziza echinospora]
MYGARGRRRGQRASLPAVPTSIPRPPSLAPHTALDLTLAPIHRDTSQPFELVLAPSDPSPPLQPCPSIQTAASPPRSYCTAIPLPSLIIPLSSSLITSSLPPPPTPVLRSLAFPDADSLHLPLFDLTILRLRFDRLSSCLTPSSTRLTNI